MIRGTQGRRVSVVQFIEERPVLILYQAVGEIQEILPASLVPSSEHLTHPA